jgi:large subunit ribosomal protein L25
MNDVLLQGSIRTNDTKGSVRELRRKGMVPSVLYGKKAEPIKLFVDSKETIRVFSIKGTNALFQLNIDGNVKNVTVKEIQKDPIKGDLIHIDFMAVYLTDKLLTKVPVVLIGSSVGVKEGGVLQQQKRELEIKCLASEIPEYLELDISNLNMGEGMTVKDIPTGKYEILDNPEETVVTIAAPRVAETEDKKEEAEEPKIVAED